MKKLTINHEISIAQEEYRLYEQSKDTIYLGQVAEKIYVTYIHLLEYLTNQTIKTHDEVRALGKYLGSSDFVMKTLYYDTDILHVYHYNRRLDTERIEQKVKQSFKNILFKTS